MAPQSGVMLQNRGRSFRIEEGHGNAVAPGKRPMHTIIPGMAVKDGKAVAPSGAMGGQYQSTAHAHCIATTLDHARDARPAMDRSRRFRTAGHRQRENTVGREPSG